MPRFDRTGIVGRRIAWLVVFAWLAASAEARSAESQWISTFRVMSGDDLAWAAPSWDDSDWSETSLYDLRPSAPIFWLRARVDLDPALVASGRPLGARFVALASCELFWNGEALGENGTVGARPSEERPGEIDWLVPLPANLDAGPHVVALRCSAHHRGFDPFIGFYAFGIGDLVEMADDAGSERAAQTVFGAGALWAIGLFHVLTFVFGTRSRSHLWLGLFACASGALVIVESLRALVGYSYDLHIWRLLAIAALTWAINALLLAFVTARFPLAGRRRFLAVCHALLLACLAAPAFDAKSAYLFLVGLLAAFAWSTRALVAGRGDAVYTVAGLAICLGVGAWWRAAFLDYTLFFGLVLLCLVLLVSHVVADARERREHAATELRSARLEIELLRRHLQPHFLMNTLTALAEWFEERPEVASEMVEDLGRELRILSDVSSRSSIPLGQELDLCRSHLAVMARRRDEQLVLDAEGVDPEASIPPALVHTLLENALTHNAYRGEPARFTLRQHLDGRWRTLVFEAPYRPRPSAGERPVVEGTGLRYVRARLRENHGEHFELESRPATSADGESVWRTVIRWPTRATAP